MATEQLRLVDGTIVRKCPTDKPLYCSREGKFYSVRNAELTDDGWILREIKAGFSPAMRTPGRHCFNGKRGCVYPIMRRYGEQMCHKLVALTWIGPRPEGYEIDHINGDILNWSAENLEYVTPAENRKRAKILRCMREAGNDPTKLSAARLKAIFAQYELMDGDTQIIREMTKHQEL